ncbi:MAG TPA: malate synthase A [Candidatus Xenobia bacterium]|jgi:malate synthase
MSADTVQTSGIQIHGKMAPGYDSILTPEALRFLEKLHTTFDTRRQVALVKRSARLRLIRAGEVPNFLPETRTVRESDEWSVAAVPADLKDRRVEITGPVERKMIINALNSGANVFMADFEDSNTPTWANLMDGQINLRDAVRRTITFNDKYKLKEQVATLMVRPRGWHMEDKHISINGKPLSGSLMDFGLFFFHNAKELIARKTGPYFYLPKLESHLEARLWNDVFNTSQDELKIPRGTIKATVLIETILAAFEMDEILYELRDHSAGLNCGRWDYIFSFIKKFRYDARFVLPDRATITMDKHFLKSYSDLLVKSCHRRGAYAIGGMAAYIPVKTDTAANDKALAKVKQDKEREVKAGYDGTWVAHPALVPVAKAVFDAKLKKLHNQFKVMREDVQVLQADLLTVPEGEITPEGVQLNVDVAIQYIASWLKGTGCVPIYDLMEDAATAEISRAQLWQWRQHGATMSDGRVVTAEVIEGVVKEELARIKTEVGASKYKSGKFDQASKILLEMVMASELPDHLTTVAYEFI